MHSGARSKKMATEQTLASAICYVTSGAIRGSGKLVVLVELVLDTPAQKKNPGGG
jgi:hypothetical protein